MNISHYSIRYDSGRINYSVSVDSFHQSVAIGSLCNFVILSFMSLLDVTELIYINGTRQMNYFYYLLMFICIQEWFIGWVLLSIKKTFLSSVFWLKGGKTMGVTHDPRPFLLFWHLVSIIDELTANESSSYFSAVISTEKTNILLRYLHQHWDKKVSFKFA